MHRNNKLIVINCEQLNARYFKIKLKLEQASLFFFRIPTASHHFKFLFKKNTIIELGTENVEFLYS